MMELLAGAVSTDMPEGLFMSHIFSIVTAALLERV